MLVSAIICSERNFEVIGNVALCFFSIFCVFFIICIMKRENANVADCIIYSKNICCLFLGVSFYGKDIILVLIDTRAN